ncbi:MAG: hypothetical protein ACRDWA_02550 [Acidimicrobiia bacterium]
MRVHRRALLALVALLMMSCQGGTTTETTAAPVETTDATEETSDSGSVGSVEDMPAECVDALRDYLRAIEPIVEGVDFQSTTMSDFEALGEELADATEGFEERTESCPDLDVSTAESFDLIREFAESEAPGTVAYFNFIEEFVGSFEETGAASGDCETDIAAFQEYVDRTDSMSELTASEVAAASNLMSTIAVVCSDERFLEWQEEISDWTSG